MNDSANALSEELFSRRQTLAALLMLAAGVALGSAATRELVDSASGLYSTLSILRASGVFVAAAILVLLVILKLYQLFTGSLGRFLDGFIQHAVMKATAFSWAATAIVLVVMTEQIEGGNLLPTIFYTKLAMAVLCASFGLAYLFYTWIPTESE